MVRDQVEARGIRDRRVLAAMAAVPRHRFLDRGLAAQAYGDHAFPIGFDQTISKPFMVAYLAECLELTGRERVLEIGTGTGYQAAVLARLAREVWTVERIAELASRAERVLKDLGFTNVHVRWGDGNAGWPEAAPFDRILLTASASRIPRKLLDQLADGGWLVGPVGSGEAQRIVRVKRGPEGWRATSLRPCRFVPLERGTRRR
jgi:protein-L-isoaspartate(D-aspartate) O-methyltransferase